MPTPEARLLSLATVVLAGVQFGLPWAIGGRSPLGQASLVLPLVLVAATGLLPRGFGPILRPTPVVLAAGILAGISALHTIYPDRTVQTLLLLLAYILAGTLAARSSQELPWAEPVLLTAILASGVLASGVGMLRLFLKSDEGVYASLLTGPFGYPNAMAGFLLLVGGAALAAARQGPGPAVRGAGIFAGAMSALGIFLTGSRGALLAGAAGIAVWAAVERRIWWPRRRLWLWLAGLGLLALLVWGSSRLSGVASLLWNRGGDGAWDSSLLWRAHILRWTWAMARDHPWWGVGPGAFPVALKHYQRLPYVSGENPHNLYLELAAEYGLPAGILAVLTLGSFLGRAGISITQAVRDDPARRRLAALLAGLVAFAVHSLVDMGWSFPAVATTAAVMLGLVSTSLRAKRPRRHRAEPGWRAVLLLLLTTAAILALTRYYASTLVTWGRLALAVGQTATAQRELTWALRLNPLSFPAHLWMTRVRLRSGDLQGAAEVAERAVRIAPLDPDSQYLAGEVAVAAGQWEAALARFRGAVERAPFAQLRPHAGLVESAVRAGRTAESRWWYERATTMFSPERVLEAEVRCLAPGDRYLLARMSRIIAQAGVGAGDPSWQQGVMERARILAQPDSRGICVTQGRPGQTSPEAAAESFWRALGEGGWPLAQQFVVAELRQPPGDGRSEWHMRESTRQARVAWIAALSGGERQANLRLELEVETARGNLVPRCVEMHFRIIRNDWFVERLPTLEAGPCRP